MELYEYRGCIHACMYAAHCVMLVGNSFSVFHLIYSVVVHSYEVIIEVKPEDQILRVGTLKDVEQELGVLVKL